MDEPLYPAAARRLARGILASGEYAETFHAGDKEAEFGMDTDIARQIIRNGVVTDVRLEHGSWRYRFHLAVEGTVVVAFVSERRLVVVTVWR